jgi:hypothetical protein
MSNEQPEQSPQGPAPKRSLLQWDEGIRLTSAQLGLLTIGQVEQILGTGSLETHLSFFNLFAPMAQLASSEAARAFSLLTAGARAHAIEGEGTPNWGLFFSELKRDVELAEAVTDQTTMRHLSELLWERHTAP